MSWLRFLAYCVCGLLALGAIGLFLSIVTFRVRWDDGPPDPPAGDMPNVPDEARGKR